MKPRIIFFGDVWCCGILRGPKWQRIGKGSSPKEAYDDWKAKWEAAQC